MFPIRICIEGNIGSGKTTIVNIIKNNFNNNRTIFVPDTINNWKNKELLNNFYLNTNRYALLMELKSTSDKIKYINNINKQILFFSKSWMSDKYCYMKTLKELNYILPSEFNTYNNTYELMKNSMPNIDLMIYVKNSVSNCYENIKDRKIDYELNITMKFLMKLSENYELWIDSYTDSPLIVVDMQNFSEEDFINSIYEAIPEFSKIYYKSV